MTRRNLAKPFSIAGYIIGEIYMAFTVFAPLRSGEIVPLAHQIKRVVALAPFFGVFGALVGFGIGMVIMALLPKR